MKVAFACFDRAYTAQKQELDDAYHRVMDSNRLILGKEVEAFEAEFASYSQTKHCIGVANGLEAIQLILRAHGIGAGDEVIVAANTYIATWLGVTLEGAKPVPVEPIEATYNLDPQRISQAVTPRTKAILGTHLYGQSADLDGVEEVAKRLGIPVFWDAAQAHGAVFRGTPIARSGTATAFSFYPTKNLGALGDAGAITTEDDALAHKYRALRNYGSHQRYRNEMIGYNSRLDELQAAFLRCKLKTLHAWTQRRQEITQIYHQRLATAPGLTLPHVPEGHQPVWHLYVTRHSQRDKLKELLAQRGVETDVHYPTPPHLQNAYRSLGHHEGDFPITERIHREVLSLPLHPFLTPEEIDHVCQQTTEACKDLCSP